MPRMAAERDPNTAARAPLKNLSTHRPYRQRVSFGLNRAPSRRQIRPSTIMAASAIVTLSRSWLNAPKLDGNRRMTKVNTNNSPIPTQRSITTLMVASRQSLPKCARNHTRTPSPAITGQYLTEKLGNSCGHAHPKPRQLPAAHRQNFGDLQPTQSDERDL